MDNTDFYVILTSRNDVLYKLDAWSKNYYLASVYYRQIKKQHRDSLFKVYSSSNDECMKMLYLARYLKRDYDVGVDDIIESELKIMSSKDDKLCAIYKSKYHESFTTHSSNIIPGIYEDIVDALSKVFLRPAPLTKYIHDSKNILFDVLFRSYNYMVLEQSVTELDMVYLWFCLLRLPQINFIADFHRDIIPIDSVFIRVNEY